MARHHTKDKGDLGVAKVYADLVARGLIVLMPMTEHGPFDLVAYDGTFHRIQVKYRSARRGAIEVQFRSMWADRHGTHISPVDKDQVDILAIYCPETEDCYYLRPADYASSITLRVRAAANGQVSGVRSASLFQAFPPTPASLSGIS